MTIQLVMIDDHAILSDDFEGVTEDLEIGLELEFEHSLIFAVNADHANVFAFVRVFHDAVNEAVRDTIKRGFLRVFDTIWLEMQLVITEVELANVLGFLQFTYFCAKLRYFFG